MVARTVHALDELQIPVERRLEIVTKASLVQAEAGSVEDMGKVAGCWRTAWPTAWPCNWTPR